MSASVWSELTAWNLETISISIAIGGLLLIFRLLWRDR